MVIVQGQKGQTATKDGDYETTSFNDKDKNQPYATVTTTRGNTDANRNEGNTRIDIFDINLPENQRAEKAKVLNFPKPIDIKDPNALQKAIDDYNKEHGTSYSIPAITKK